MSKWLDGFKVGREGAGRLYSVCAGVVGGDETRYFKTTATTRTERGGPLAVFGSVKSAQSFVARCPIFSGRNIGRLASVRIFSCRYRRSRQRSLWARTNWRTIYRHFTLHECPTGTHLADEVILGERVT